MGRKHIVAALLPFALALSACGAARHVAIVRPARPINVSCRTGNLEARRLLGHTLGAAQHIASTVGCDVRPTELDGRALIIDDVWESWRIDVVVRSNTVVELRRLG
jgi:hypothetical protein